MRFFNRCWIWSWLVGRPITEEAGVVYRIGIGTAWEMAGILA